MKHLGRYKIVPPFLHFVEPLCPDGHSCVARCPEIEELKNSPIFIRNSLVEGLIEVNFTALKSTHKSRSTHEIIS